MIPARHYHATATCLISIYVHSRGSPNWGVARASELLNDTNTNNSREPLPQNCGHQHNLNNNGTATRHKYYRKQKMVKTAFFISVYVFSAQSQLPGVSSDSACCVLSCTQKSKAQKNKLIFKRHIATLGTPWRKEPDRRRMSNVMELTFSLSF